MAFETPTVTEIRDRMIADVETEFSPAGPRLRKNLIRVLATVFSGAIYLLYKLALRIILNILPTTAQGEFLDDIGKSYGLTRTRGTTWTGTANLIRSVSVVQHNDPAIGTTYRAADGNLYTVIATTNNQDATAAPPYGSVRVSLRSEITGAVATRVAGEILTGQIQIPGLPDKITILTTSVTGSDEETDDEFRTRILDRVSGRPQGGSFNDYIAWAKEVSGVTRVWVYEYATTSPYIKIYFVRDNDDNRIPTAAQRNTVFDYIRSPARKPVGASIQVLSPRETPVTVRVTGYQSHTNQGNETLIREQIAEYLLNRPAGALNPVLGISAAEQQIRISNLQDRVFQYGAYVTVSATVLEEYMGLTINTNINASFNLREGEICRLSRLIINGVEIT